MRKHKSEETKYQGFADRILQSKPAVLIFSILAFLLGLLGFILPQAENKPISRNEAVAYEGEWKEYEIFGDNYRTIYLQDGSSYSVYPHTETQDFQEKLLALEAGTKVYLLVNPNNDCVIEIKTETEELLNFESSQKAIAAYGNGYVVLGIFLCLTGVFLAVFGLASSRYKKIETERHDRKNKLRVDEQDDVALRRADPSVKCRILLEQQVDAYKICYRRVKHVNELVINGFVYDEKKGVIEFVHELTAVVDGHMITAGYDDNSYSYITFDGSLVTQKRRLI